jgi:hypothetical protein
VETSASLTSTNGTSLSLDWQTGGSWAVGLLPAGDYTLKVEARNLAGNTIVSQGFTVSAPVALPVVQLDALPTQINSTAIPLAWSVVSGADIIDHFEIQSQVDSGDWTLWDTKPAAADRAATFDAEMGHAYHFRIRGVEANGKAVDFSSAADVTTVVSGTCQEDSFEGTAPGDDEQSGAASIELGKSQQHNWCAAGDVDWVALQATKSQVLRLTTTPSGKNSAAIEQLYDSDGTTLLGENHPTDANSGASLDWTVPADGIYYVKLSPVDSQISGTDTDYTFGVEVQNTVQTTPLICGSISIPLLLGGAYTLVSKKVQKKKSAKRAGWN